MVYTYMRVHMCEERYVCENVVWYNRVCVWIVYIWVLLCVYIHVTVYVQTSICASVYCESYAWVCVCGYVNMHVWLYVSGCMCELFVTVSISEYVCVSTVCLCVHTWVVNLWICVYGCVCMPLGLATPLVWPQGWMKTWSISAGVKGVCHHPPTPRVFTTM